MPIHIFTLVVKVLVSFVALILSVLLIKHLLKSILKSAKSLGVPMFCLMVVFFSSVVSMFYYSGGFMQGMYALICVLALHMVMWTVGYFE